MGLKLPCIEFRGRRLDSSLSFLILFTGLFLSVAMPLLIPRDPGPDAMTLWSSYARADNCNFWNPFSPDRSSYECSAFLLRPTGINLTNAWAYGMFCNFFLTAIPVVVFRRMPLAIFGTLCLFFNLPFEAKIVLPIWGGIGLVVYFLYGYRKSDLARKATPGS